MKNGESIIEVRGMTKRFGELTAVDHVDLTVRAGEIYGFLGPNGSGKTTFLRMLCGLLHADDGSGRVLGHDVIAESEAIKREVGYMTQRFSFWEDLSIEENLDFVARMYDVKNRRQTVRASLDQLGLAERKTNSPASFPADGSNVLRSPPVSFIGQNCCCSMSRRLVSIQKRVAISGKRFIDSPPRDSLFSSPRITWMKPSAASGWLTFPRANCSRTARSTK